MYYQCCAYCWRATVLRCALFEKKIPFINWFFALYLLTSTRSNLLALKLKRRLDVRYRAVSRLKHKVMQAMKEREGVRQLADFAKLDDASLGGGRNGCKAGRGSEDKQPFIIVVSTDDHLEQHTFAVIEPIRGFNDHSKIEWEQRCLTRDAEVYRDGLWCFRRFADAGHAHTVHDTPRGRATTEVKGRV